MNTCRARVMVLSAVAALIASSCSGARVPDEDPTHDAAFQQCASWDDLSDPQDAFDDAVAVVIGTVDPAHGSTTMFGIDAALHDVEILQTLKGDLSESVLVASTPETCTSGATYPHGDLLDAEGTLILFLTTQSADGAWPTITPFDGVLPLPDDGSLPFDTTATSDE